MVVLQGLGVRSNGPHLELPGHCCMVFWALRLSWQCPEHDGWSLSDAKPLWLKCADVSQAFVCTTFVVFLFEGLMHTIFGLKLSKFGCVGERQSRSC